jgi:sarcosine oxidase
MEKRAEVVVVGAGVMGLASSWALTRAGRDVIVLEQFHVGHDQGSSHGSTRIFRLAYDEPDWVASAGESLGLWRELEAESGLELIAPLGFLDTGRDSTALRAALDSGRAEYEVLSADDVDRRFGVTIAGDEAVLDPLGGIVWAERALEAFRRSATVIEETTVTALHPYGTGIRLETSSGPIEADVAVVAAGPWARPLLAAAGIELPVVETRETVAFFALENNAPLPSIGDWAPEGGDLVFSLEAGEGLVKVGLHHAGARVDPATPGAPDPAAVAIVTDWAQFHFRLADPEPATVETCFYTTTADEKFLLERHGPIVVCSACSGHGFKFAPAVGKRVAGLA